MEKVRIGIIGCGAIGKEVAMACQGSLSRSVILAGICDKKDEAVRSLNRRLSKRVREMNIDEVVNASDLVVEAAGASVSVDILNKCIRRKKNCMIMSVGGILGNEKLLDKASRLGVKVFLPSGALCGIDGLKSAAVGKIASVTLTTRKPPRALAGAVYIEKNNIDLSGIKKETLVFQGSALEAVRAFPQNINVSAVLSLAGIGAKKTRVRIVASPGYKSNTHEVEIKGEFGTIFTRAQNLPSKTNPKTSALAIYSAIATLKGAVDSVRIGT